MKMGARAICLVGAMLMLASCGGGGSGPAGSETRSSPPTRVASGLLFKAQTASECPVLDAASMVVEIRDGDGRLVASAEARFAGSQQQGQTCLVIRRYSAELTDAALYVVSTEDPIIFGDSTYPHEITADGSASVTHEQLEAHGFKFPDLGLEP